MEENIDKEVKKVLIVDDEQAIIDVLVYNLKNKRKNNSNTCTIKKIVI